MMYTYPYYGFPKRYTRYNSFYPQYTLNDSNVFPHNTHLNENNRNSVVHNSSLESKVNDSDKNRNSSSENPLFEIFGIKLYFDDILLICLIFFLYQEGVQDQYLFISLILLLLS